MACQNTAVIRCYHCCFYNAPPMQPLPPPMHWALDSGNRMAWGALEWSRRSLNSHSN
ncbi:Hypothetical predicted protein, partial [Pelobates cultripes]